jgi:hypothetical protein
VFYDVTNRTSFENIDNWLNFIPQPEVSDEIKVSFYYIFVSVFIELSGRTNSTVIKTE